MRIVCVCVCVCACTFCMCFPPLNKQIGEHQYGIQYLPVKIKLLLGKPEAH